MALAPTPGEPIDDRDASHTTRPPETLQCLQVWGDNRATDSGVAMPGLDAWVHSRPAGADDAGGDVYYVSSCASGRIIRLLVADVSGHGASVASIATTLRRLMRRYMNHPNQGKLLAAINREFLERSKLGQFATASMISCWTPTGELTISIAGHPSPLRFDAATAEWSPLFQAGEHANIPLGIDERAKFDQVKVTLGDDDMLMIFSDGLIEDRDRDGHQLAQHGVLGLLADITAEGGTADAGALVPDLIDRVSARRDGTEAEDDITVMLVRPNGLRPKITVLSELAAGARLAKGLVASLREPKGAPAT